MYHRPTWSFAAVRRLLAGALLAVLPGEAALGQDATRLSGEMFIGTQSTPSMQALAD